MTPDRRHLEHLARTTGNPAFIWELIATCDTAEDCPEWAWAYIHGCAARLIALDADPKQLPVAILDALGLAGPGGPGAFRKADTARRRHDAIQMMDVLIDLGVPVNEAAESVSQDTELSPSTLRGYFYEARRTGVSRVL